MSWLSFIPYHVASDLLQHPEASPIGHEQRLEAVALFADVSGFTVISEALAGSSKTGAEELTAILNSYFDPMIALIESYGGIIGKFGGDAMTVLFPVSSGQWSVISGQKKAGSPNTQHSALSTQHFVIRRAIQCALDMQANMPRYAAIPTSSGVFSLAMKAGLAMGTTFCTSVGNDYRLEYLIAGQLLDRCAEAEHHATKGEVVIHNDLLKALGSRAAEVEIVEERGDFSCVGNMQPQAESAPLEPFPALSPQMTQMVARYLHPTLAERLEASQENFINEHRKVTVLFVSFQGFDYDHDPQIGGKLQAYLTEVIEIIRKYDGYLNKVDMGDKGSKFIALFGAPVAHENDEERALRCGLELIACSAKHVAAVRIGVNTGFVYCGQVGSQLRQEYTVMGDAVNLSARLMQAAKPGQIMVSGFTRRYVPERFKWQEFDPIKVKGKTEPIPVQALEAVETHSTASFWARLLVPAYALPMVGREAELEIINRKLDQVLQNRGQLIGVTAEAGMGKSRLNAEIIRLAVQRGLGGFAGECLSFGTNISYLVWRNIWQGFFGINPASSPESQLRQLQEQLAALNPAFLPRLPLLDVVLNLTIPDNELTAALDAKLRKESRESLLVDCLRAWILGSAPNSQPVTSTPTLLILEDCHWIDPLSQDLLEAIGRNVADLPVLLVLLYRPPQEAALEHLRTARLKAFSHFTEIGLKEFSLPEAQQLIELKLEQLFHGRFEEEGASAELVARLTAKGQGNPFYIDEMVNLIQDKGLDPTDPQALAQLELPDSLYSLIISRVDQLAEGEKTTLKVASVVGRIFRAGWLWGAYPQLGSPAQVQQQLTNLGQRDLTRLDKPGPDMEYMFKHIITQEVAYESLSVAIREMLHQEIGRYIEQSYPELLDTFLDILAFHYGRSPNLDKQREYFLKAGQAAQVAYANTAAINYYQRLLPIIPEAEKWDLLHKLAGVLILVGKLPDAEASYREALILAQSAGQTPHEIDDLYSIGYLRILRSAYPEALDWLEQARLKAEETSDQRRLGRVLANLGLLYSRRGEYNKALECHQRYLAIATELNERRDIATAILNIGTVYREQGDLAQAFEYHTQHLQLATELNDPRAISQAVGNLGIVYRQQGRYSEALEAYNQVLKIAAEMGDKRSISRVLTNMGNIYEDCGDYISALACQGQFWQYALETNENRMAVVAMGNMADVYSKFGNFQEAERLYQPTMALCRKLKLDPLLCVYLYNYAELLARAGRYSEAQELNRQSQELADKLGHKEYQFKSRLLEIRLKGVLDEKPIEELLGELEELKAQWSQADHQAAINYTVWRLDPDQESSRQKGAELYAGLYAKSPSADYRERYQELTGETLASPALPELPELVKRNPASVEKLLAQMD